MKTMNKTQSLAIRLQAAKRKLLVEQLALSDARIMAPMDVARCVRRVNKAINTVESLKTGAIAL